MKHLGDNPLTIRVVLKNISYQTPSRSWRALKEGGIVQDFDIQYEIERLCAVSNTGMADLVPEIRSFSCAWLL